MMGINRHINDQKDSSESTLPSQVNIYDPIKNSLMMQIKNPKIPIELKIREGNAIDLEKAFKGMESEDPDFGFLDNIDFDE